MSIDVQNIILPGDVHGPLFCTQACTKSCPECGQQSCDRVCGDCEQCAPCEAFVEKEFDCGCSAQLPCNFAVDLKECEDCEDQRMQSANIPVDTGAPGNIQNDWRVYIGKEGRKGNIAYSLTLTKNDIG